APQRRFKVFRIDVHACRRDDDVLLAALEIEIPFGIERAQVARVEPPGMISAARDRANLTVLPVARGDVLSPHQDFAARIKLHFAAFKYLANRAAPQPERVIHADQGSRFRQTVTLNRGESGASPEEFGTGAERRASGNDGPEFPAEALVNPAETPHAADEFLVCSCVEFAAECFEAAFGFQIALDLVLQRLEHARHAN